MLDVLEFRRGDLVEVVRQPDAGEAPPDVDQLILIGVRQRSKQRRVEDAEHRGVRADAERESQDGRDGERGRLRQ
jgi:hypothetical protein